MYVCMYVCIYLLLLHCKVTNCYGTAAIEEEAKEAHKLLMLAEEVSNSLGAAQRYSVLRQQAIRCTAVCAIFSRQV